MADDVLARSEVFLHPCGSCDARLPMGCTCPEGDYRPAMKALYDEVVALRGLINSMPHTNEQLYDWLREQGINLGAGPGVLLCAMRADLRKSAGLDNPGDIR